MSRTALIVIDVQESFRVRPNWQLVNHPDAVEVKETPSDTTTVLELRVAKEDIGRVIGKQGRTAKSIREPRGRKPASIWAKWATALEEGAP